MKKKTESNSQSHVIIDVADDDILSPLHSPLSQGEVSVTHRHDQSVDNKRYNKTGLPGEVSTDTSVVSVEMSEDMIAAVVDLSDRAHLSLSENDLNHDAEMFARFQNSPSSISNLSGNMSNFDVIGIPPEPPKNPTTLPDIIRSAIYDRSQKQGEVPPSSVKWRQFSTLPGYFQQMIRAYGRNIFKSFPCFEEQEKVSQSLHKDPLADIKVLFRFEGQENVSQNSKSEMDTIAAWMTKNGRIIMSGQIDLPQMPADYNPRIIFGVTEDTSILMVEETPQNTPFNRTQRYIYAWKGGTHYYNENMLTFEETQKALPSRSHSTAKAHNRPIALEAPVIERTAKSNNFVDALKKNDFAMKCDKRGTHLIKTLDNGDVVKIYGEYGRSLMSSTNLKLVINETEENVSPISIEDRIAQISVSSLKM